MKPSDLELGHILTADFRLEGPTPTVRQPVVVDSWASEGKDELSLRLPEADPLRLQAVSREARGFIGALQDAGPASVLYVARIRERTVRLKAHRFALHMLFPTSAPLEILVTERVEHDLPQEWRDRPSDFLRNRFLLNGRAFALAGERAQDVGFRLVGDGYLCDVLRAGAVFECDRIQEDRSRRQHGAAALLLGDIRFVKAPFADRHGTTLATAVAQGLARQDHYLAQWEVYNQLQREAVREEAAEIGEVEYTSYTHADEGDAVYYEFELSGPAPPGFRTGDLDLDATATSLADEAFPDLSDNQQRHERGGACPVGMIERISLDRRRIRTCCRSTGTIRKPEPAGHLLRSMIGDTMSLNRRDRALAAVRSGRTPLLTLAGLLEEGTAVPERSLRRENALSQAVHDVLGHEPTQSQRQALDVALNTPDIALIQGPPGTGKTSVIRALMVRIAELSEKRGTNADILVTSQQHDAVSNATKALTICGLPAWRVGGRRGSGSEEREMTINQWALERQRACDQSLGRLDGSPVRRAARNVDRLIHQHARARGGSEHTTVLLQEIQLTASPHLPPSLNRRLERAIMAFQSPQATPQIDPDDLRIDLLRALDERLGRQRLAAEAFRCDGPAMAGQLVRFLEGMGAELSITPPPGLLVAAAETFSTPAGELDQIVADLQDAVSLLRDQSLRALASREIPMSPADLEQLLSEVSQVMWCVPPTRSDRMADAVADFRDDMDNHQLVEQMIEQYSAVIAGTCQQVMPGSASDAPRQYEVVIVDEAARANPLDLLIPMSMGKRIVLVGDHKQLPHALEPSVVQKLSGNLGPEAAKLLEVSLFERLFARFRDQQLEGGTQRVVTLLDDFRMHPVISRFVSSQFYPEENLSPRRKAIERAHDLGVYENKPVCWIDIPQSRGLEQGGQSKWRAAEARVVAAEVERILHADTDEQFSLGIITFYERQKQEIERQVGAFPQNLLDRVKVGTVDSYQGLEFDIVVLSTVRCNAATVEQARLGFLGRPNRLCVSLSRARRLLVVVGDSETVAGTAPLLGVPALRVFLELCRSRDGFYERR